MSTVEQQGTPPVGGRARRCDLPASPEAVPTARRFVREALAGLGAAEHTEVAELLTSELVTNAVVHAAGVVAIAVEGGRNRARVTVDDASDALPTMRPRMPEAEGGHGIVLVEELAAGWGVEALPAGKRVWFEVSGVEATGASDGAGASDEPVGGLAALRDRAMIATDISVSISDPTRPDNPLVWSNPAFTRLTGYELAEIRGMNCRFLQGPGTTDDARTELRDAVAARQPGVTRILNYRKDGTAFWNELSISPIFDDDGALTHFVGVQSDITARVRVEEEREHAYEAEHLARADAEQARAEAEAAHTQMALLVEATTLLTATLELDEALRRLADLAVPFLADWCLVHLDDLGDGPARSFAAHADPEQSKRLDAELRDTGRTQRASPAVARVLDGASGGVLTTVSGVIDLAELLPPELKAPDGLAAASAIVVPLRARRRTLGALTLVRTPDAARQYQPEELRLARDLARRAAFAVDNARLYTHEQRIAETLQRSFLPDLRPVPGLEVAARYQAGATGNDVGGDWYDVLALPDDAIGVTIGDVMGHDIRAAASMGQIRNALRGYAWEGGGPCDVLDRVDDLIRGVGITELATAVYARIERHEDLDTATLRYCSAGHLPMVLRRADGAVTLLQDAQTLLLGLPEVEPRRSGTVTLEVGDTLLLYTDGLVERRDADISERVDQLASEVASLPAGATPEALCDAVLAAVAGEELSDDIALLALRLAARPPEGQESEDATS